MSANLKEHPNLDGANDTTCLTVVQPKSLAELMTLPAETPDNFLDDPKWVEIIGHIAALSKTIVHADEPSCKAATANLKKCLTWFSGSRVAAVKMRNAGTTERADRFIAFEKQIKAIADGYPVQFQAAQKARLAAIKKTLTDALNVAWEDLGVSERFRTSAVTEPKESLLTPTGTLTAGAKRAITALAQADKNWQFEIERRTALVELECFRAGIDTPFSPLYIGPDFDNKDPALFMTRLDLLIAEHLKLKKDMEAKVLANQAAQPPKIAEALAGQPNQDGQAVREKVATENAPAASGQPSNLKPAQASAAASRPVTASPAQAWPTPAPPTPQANVGLLTGAVIVTVVFADEGYFNEIPEPIRDKVVSFEKVVTFRLTLKAPISQENLIASMKKRFELSQAKAIKQVAVISG